MVFISLITIKSNLATRRFMVKPIIKPNPVMYPVHGRTRFNHQIGPVLKILPVTYNEHGETRTFG